MGTAYKIIGKKFGKLKVLKRLPNKNTRQSWWLCRCECGTEKEVKGLKLVRDDTTSCGCEVSTAHNFKGCGELSGKYWRQIKKHAATRKLDFDLTIEEAWTIFQNQNGKCALSDLDIKLARNYGGSKIRQTASLDRKCSKTKYCKSNVQWVHVDVNKMKNNLPESRLFQLCELVTQKLRKASDCRR